MLEEIEKEERSTEGEVQTPLKEARERFWQYMQILMFRYVRL